jgi:hypothetical protein
MMEEVRKDPEGLDIEKLRFDALSSLDEITSSYEVAAGDSGVTMYSLVMKKWMKLINVARKRSLENIKSKLRETQGMNEYLNEVGEGLQTAVPAPCKAKRASFLSPRSKPSLRLTMLLLPKWR